MNDKDALKVDYAKVTDSVVGSEHGLSKDDFDGLAERISRVVEQIESSRAQGQRRYRELPYDESMLQAVEAA